MQTIYSKKILALDETIKFNNFDEAVSFDALTLVKKRGATSTLLIIRYDVNRFLLNEHHEITLGSFEENDGLFTPNPQISDAYFKPFRKQLEKLEIFENADDGIYIHLDEKA